MGLITFARRHLIILAIVALAFGVRVAQTPLLPPALNWDEVSHGYNAYSILRTGKDEWGVPLPTIFRAYGDYKLPVYIYLTAISEFFFGLSEFSVRLPSILAGSLSVLFTYLLVNELYKKKNIALLAAFLLAVEPWSFFTSRIAVEANVAVCLIIAGVYFFLRSLRSPAYLPLSVVFLGLSVWTYNSARIFVPLLTLCLLFIYGTELKQYPRKLLIGCLLPLAFFFLPMFYQLVNPAGQARYAWVQILDTGAIERIIQERAKVNLPAPLPRLLVNKVTYFGVEFGKNCLAHFSPEFLFLTGGSHYQFSVPGHGLLYLPDLPFFVLGIIAVGRKLKEKPNQLAVAWLLLAPIASSLTREAPHALRSLVILPLPMVLSATGLFFVLDRLRKTMARAIFAGFLILIALSIENYVVRLSTYIREYSWAWQYGYKEAVTYLKSNYSRYDQIIITKKYGEPHEFILFFWPWEPEKYIKDPNLVRFNQSDWYWVDRFDKFFFVNDWQIPQKGILFTAESKATTNCAGIKCLLVTSPGNYPSGWHKLETINFLDGKSAFEMYEN